MNNPSGNGKSSNIQIPVVNRDGSLLTRLLPIAIIGADRVLDKQSQLYFRLLVRLVDKAFDEYSTAREYINKEIETNDKLAYRFGIINHLENCLNAINRAAKTFKTSMNGKNKLLDYMSKESLEKIAKCDTSTVRNRVEHIDEDIQKGKLHGPIFLDVDNNYEKICISNKCATFPDLVAIIESYHEAVLEICINLPNRRKVSTG